MKKRANMSFTIFVALLVVCCGAALINISVSSKYNSKTEYQRMKNRYIAECGIDTAVGLFINYLDNRDLEVSYTKNEDGSFSINSIYKCAGKIRKFIVIMHIYKESIQNQGDVITHAALGSFYNCFDFIIVFVF